VREKREKSLSYDFAFRKLDGGASVEVARGSLTVVCVMVDPQTDQMKAVPIPDAIARQIEVAPEVSS
jgi:acyl-CoA thioesterase FadM